MAAEGFACKPEEYERLEELLVPEDDRTSEKYDGYYLVFNKRDVGDKLQGASFLGTAENCSTKARSSDRST